MTFEEIQESAFTLTDKEMEKTGRTVTQAYRQALKDIDKQLKKTYLTLLSDVDPKDYIKAMNKYNRLRLLQQEIVQAYNRASREAQKLSTKFSIWGMNNVYYRQMYASDLVVPQKVAIVLDDTVIKTSVYGSPEVWKEIKAQRLRNIEKLYGSLSGYLPQAGTLLNVVWDENRKKDLVKIQQYLTQTFIKGDGYRKAVKGLSGIMSNSAENALRILRTEGHRNQMAGQFAMSQAAKAEGVDVKRKIISTLDSRTRSQSETVNGQVEDAQGYFTYPGGVKVKYPGNTGVAKWDINDRERVVNTVGGVPPNITRVKDPETGESKLISWADYDSWLKENGFSY